MRVLKECEERSARRERESREGVRVEKDREQEKCE